MLKLIILAAFVVALIVWACCRAAGMADAEMERHYREHRADLDSRRGDAVGGTETKA
jgi:hypothetical protein